MRKLIFKLFFVIFGILVNTHFVKAGVLEKRIYPTPVFLEDRRINSGIFIEVPFKKYNITVDQFLKQRSRLGQEEKALKGFIICRREWTYKLCNDYFRDEQGIRMFNKNTNEKLEGTSSHGKFLRIIGSIHMEDRMFFLLETKLDSGGKDILSPGFRWKSKNNLVAVSGVLPYYEEFAMEAATRAWLNPKQHSLYLEKFVNSQSSDKFKHIANLQKNRKPEDIPEEQQVVFHFKGRPFYLNILKSNLSEDFLKDNPILNFYRKFLQAVSTGTLEEILDFYRSPGPFDERKETLEKLTDSEWVQYRSFASKDAEVRFVIDADPLYFLFYARRKGSSPEKELFNMMTIYKTPADGFKITNEGHYNNLTDLIFRTDFMKRTLKPIIMTHIKNQKKEQH